MLVIASAVGVAAITAGATLAVGLGLAIVTLRTNDKRLAGERERQAAALAADRVLADLDDLRKVLDEAAAALDGARIAVEQAHYRIAIAAHKVVVREVKADLSKEARDALDRAGPPMIALTARLRVRLGPQDAITEAFTRASDSGRDLLIAMSHLDLETGEDAGGKAAEAKAQFDRQRRRSSSLP